MKNLTKQKACIWALSALLVWSVALNLLQGDRIDALMVRITQLEETKTALNRLISELASTGYGYGNDESYEGKEGAR